MAAVYQRVEMVPPTTLPVILVILVLAPEAAAPNATLASAADAALTMGAIAADTPTNWGVMNALFGISRIQFESKEPFWCKPIMYHAPAVPSSIRKSAYATLFTAIKWFAC